MKRHHFLARLAAATLLAAALPLSAIAQAQQDTKAPQQKVLRYAFRVAETTLDPAQASDIYSRTLTSNIFEALYTYDHLARPIKFKPLTAEALPEATDNYRTWTMKVRPGIHFAEDEAFKGKRRELVAEDYVYAIKRFADPANKSPVWTYIDGFKFLGLGEQRDKALKGKRPFDYDAPVEGLRALDRRTLQIRLANPNPRFIEFLAANDLFGAVAREVVEHYGDKVVEHPVGTGPFKLVQWRRASFIALERNPGYRERYYDAEPAADDKEGQALLARFKGRRIPMIDRVEVSIVEENQPRWLAFLNGQHNLIEQVPADYVSQGMPNGKVAPNLAKQGMQGWRQVRADMATTFFNMDDPVVGGYTPERVALRRAISLGYDVEREIRLVQKGQAFPAQAPIAPHTVSYDPHFKSEMSDYDPARAKALLDLYGYTDRDGDGWREQPDGSPLKLNWSIESDSRGRQMSEQYHRSLKALGIQVQFQPGKWPELLKAARAGNFQVWHVGGMSASPDSQGALQRFDGTQVGGQNMARFRRPEFDAIYKKLSETPDGPEREALFAEARRIVVAWMPVRVRWHSFITDMAHREVIGYRRPLFWQDWWMYVDIEQ